MRTSRLGRLIGRMTAVAALGAAAMGIVGVAAQAADNGCKVQLADDFVWQGNPDDTTEREEDFTWE